MSKIIKTSAPGSTMFFGEHAVLHGGLGLAIAVNKRIHITLTPRNDTTIQIHSTLGNYESTLGKLAPFEAFNFLLAVITCYQPKTGFTLDIKSEFSHQVGLGSSAAVTVAACYALAQFTNDNLDKRSIFNKALEVIEQVQGLGSGCDLAASVYGGVIGLQIEQNLTRTIRTIQLQTVPKIALYYCGYKMKTAAVIKRVNDIEKTDPTYYLKLYNKMGKVSENAIKAIAKDDWTQVYLLMDEYQELMVELGVSDLKLNKMITSLKSSNDIHGAKISGSGLGDCILTLGETTNNYMGELIQIEISTKGIL